MRRGIESDSISGNSDEPRSFRKNYSPEQEFFLLRFNRLLLLCEEGVLPGQVKLLRWAIRSVFDDCSNLGIRDDASLLLEASNIEIRNREI